jgi:hypothetical protein
MKEFKTKPLIGLQNLGDEKYSLPNLIKIENGNNAAISGQLLNAAITGGKAVINKLNKKNKETGHWKKLGDSKIGVARSKETKEKIRLGTAHSWRAILQFTRDGEFIKEWESFAQIEKELSILLNKKIVKPPIWGVCNNKPKCKTAYGFIWKYK